MGRPLGVAMVSAVFAPSIGGIQTHTLRVSQELVRRGVEVHVLTRIEPGWPSYEEMDGVRVHRLGWAGARPRAAGGVAFIAAAALKLVELRDRIDVVHGHQLLSPALVGLLAAPVAGLPFVANPHACGPIGDVGVLSASAIGRLRLQAIVRRADAFVAVSRAIAEELVGAGAPRAAVWHVPNGVDTARFRPAEAGERRALRARLGLPLDGPLVAYGGRLAPEKGVDVLVEAWPHVLRRAPSARLCVVGSGGEEASLRARAAALGVADRIHFAGGVFDVSPHLRAADAAVLPSRTEGLPVALLEAMACALPCVATAVGGNLEVLEDGRTGRLVPTEDPRALAAGLAEALAGGGDPAPWGAAARAHVAERYALGTTADRFLDLYRALLAARGAHGALSALPRPTAR